MVDVEAVIRAHLVAQTTPALEALYALTADRIYASQSLPTDYRPADGPAILFTTRGGGQDYSSAILRPSVQYRCYAKDEEKARDAYRALYDALNDQSGVGITQSRLETQGQLLTDPESTWPYVLCAFQHSIRNS